MEKCIILFLLTGCSYISTTSILSTTENCIDVVDGTQSYSISLKAVYDLLGYADSIIKVTCPQPLSFIQFKVDGIQPEFPVKHKHEKLETDSCCLPF